METREDTLTDRALDEVEDRLHDHGSHAVAQLVALGVIALGDQVSVRNHWRARAILNATKGGDNS
jgi:uncharacterized protein (UPF0297 family)